MDNTLDFSEKLEKLVKEEVKRQAHEDFLGLVAGNWGEEDIAPLLKAMRDKSKEAWQADMLIMYLFQELITEGRIEFEEVVCSDEEVDIKTSFIPKNRYADGDTIDLSPADRLLTARLIDE